MPTNGIFDYYYDENNILRHIMTFSNKDKIHKSIYYRSQAFFLPCDILAMLGAPPREDEAELSDGPCAND